MSADVAVVGSGPNGLACAIALAQAGVSVDVFECGETPGGGMRTLPLTLDGFLHDVCSAVHPLAEASPFFRTLGLDRHGLDWVHPPSPLVHVASNGRAIVLERDLDEAASRFGADADAYRHLLAPFVSRFDEMMRMILAPLRMPENPLLLARFGLAGLGTAERLMRRFSSAELRALLAGIAAHAILPLDRLATAAFGLVLAIAAHGVGWPVARGGSQRIADALAAVLGEHGGRILCGREIRSLADLPPVRAVVFDTTPKQLVEIAGGDLPPSYRARLARYRYGAAACKVDWALSAPIPWSDPGAARSATVHLLGSFDEVASAEAVVHEGKVAGRPFVILVQPSLFDASRAPDGSHTAWAYCHVPNGCTLDVSDRIEAQVERAAPGFRDVVLARAVKTAPEMERYNPNYVGGDINGGMASLAQLFTRPVVSLDPYATPNPRLFLCSSSTPPGGGVHGMCGWWASRSVLRQLRAT